MEYDSDEGGKCSSSAFEFGWVTNTAWPFGRVLWCEGSQISRKLLRSKRRKRVVIVNEKDLKFSLRADYKLL